MLGHPPILLPAKTSGSTQVSEHRAGSGKRTQRGLHMPETQLKCSLCWQRWRAGDTDSWLRSPGISRFKTKHLVPTHLCWLLFCTSILMCLGTGTSRWQVSSPASIKSRRNAVLTTEMMVQLALYSGLGNRSTTPGFCYIRFMWTNRLASCSLVSIYHVSTV